MTARIHVTTSTRTERLGARGVEATESKQAQTCGRDLSCEVAGLHFVELLHDRLCKCLHMSFHMMFLQAGRRARFAAMRKTVVLGQSAMWETADHLTVNMILLPLRKRVAHQISETIPVLYACPGSIFARQTRRAIFMHIGNKNRGSTQ